MDREFQRPPRAGRNGTCMRCSMGIKYVSMAAFVLAAASVAMAEDAKPAAEDKAKLQGEWAMVSGVSDGVALPEAIVRSFRRVCKGDELTVMNGEQVVMKAKISLDLTKKPKAIDYEAIDGVTKGSKHEGIYEFDGETLKSCFAEPGGKRPTEFASKAGDRRVYTVWKRVKKE